MCVFVGFFCKKKSHEFYTISTYFYHKHFQINSFTRNGNE